MNRRLEAVKGLVKGGGIAVDVGCDHALLAVSLARAGTCTRIIASDVREGPVAAARRTVEAAGLAAAIDIRLGDGLSAVLPAERAQISDIVVAGMGGETVAAILAAADWVRDGRIRLVLQPMTRAATLRRWLFTHGFALEREVCVADGAHVYTAMAAAYTGEVAWREADCWLGRIPRGDAANAAGRAYRRRQLHILAQRLRGAEGAERAQLLEIEREVRAVCDE